MTNYRNFINGEWIESTSAKVARNINPANTDEVLGTVKQATRDEARAAVDAARLHPADAARIGVLGGADQALGGALGRLMAVVEGYPELKADATLRELSEELTHTENRVAFARQSFNDCVLDYNNAAQQAPVNLVASLFGFHPATALQASAAEREAVRVKF